MNKTISPKPKERKKAVKVDRLIGILSVLLQKDRVTMSELAEKFEVSRRTVVRDLEALNMAGIPIAASKGQGGGVYIMEGYRLDRTVLSSSDMRSILTGLQSLDSVSGTNRYRQLMDKLSLEGRETVKADSGILIDLARWDKSGLSQKIGLIQEAMEKNRRITFTYYAPKGESRRVIEPYHLIFQWSGWYVWGYCLLREDYRMFKLSRIRELAQSEEPREKREVPEYECDKLFHTAGEIEVTARFDRSVMWLLADEFDVERLKYDDEGNILITFTWSDLISLYSYIMTFGDKAEIISPKEYRDQFLEYLDRIRKKYK